MPDLLEEGILYFNSGRFYEAHEVWEDLWRLTHGPLRTCYQGLIQAAVGLHHLGRQNQTGGKSQLQKAIRNLQADASRAREVDIPGLIAQLQNILAHLPDGPSAAPRIARLK